MTLKVKSKWINLMNILGWNGIVVWQDMNQRLVEENVPLVEYWVRTHLKYLSQHPQEKAAFKQYYWPSKDSEKSSYTYLKKDRAECALAALYIKEQEDG